MRAADEFEDIPQQVRQRSSVRQPAVQQGEQRVQLHGSKYRRGGLSERRNCRALKRNRARDADRKLCNHILSVMNTSRAHQTLYHRRVVAGLYKYSSIRHEKEQFNRCLRLPRCCAVLQGGVTPLRSVVTGAKQRESHDLRREQLPKPRRIWARHPLISASRRARIQRGQLCLAKVKEIAMHSQKIWQDQ